MILHVKAQAGSNEFVFIGVALFTSIKTSWRHHARRREADRLEVVVDGPNFACALLRPSPSAPGALARPW